MITSDAVTNDKQSETSSSDCRDKADERCKSAVVTTLSDEEFQRLQEQLLELKNRNYELIEENKRQQNYINALPSRTTTIDSLNFATKGLQLIGRRKDREGVNEKLEHEILILRSKLSSQEEEFRLQQSTLLSELNKVISQCESLENELKQKNANSNEPKGTLPSNAELSHPTTNSDNAKAQADKIIALQGEITHFKAVLAEKDALCADIEALRKDLMASRKDCEQQLAESKKQLFEAMQRLEDAQRCNADLEVSLKTKNDEIIRLSSSLQEAEKNVELEEKNTETICSLTEAVDKLNKECDELRKTHKEDVDAKDELSNEVAALKASLHHSEVTWKKSLDNLKSERDDLRSENEKVLKMKAEIESKTLEFERTFSQNKLLIKETENLKMDFENISKANENLTEEIAQLRNTLQTVKEEKEASEMVKGEELKKLQEELSVKEERLAELARTNEAEIFVVTSELKSVNSDLETKIKENEEKLKAKDQEIKIALKKQSSMVRELRRQVLQEKKRAEQAERQLDEVLGGGRHFRVGGSPMGAGSDHARTSGAVEPASSICSWAFVADSDANSLHTLDGDESSCSASVLESDNAELISRLAMLQKKHSETVDRLSMIEEENEMLRKEVAEKSELIAEWIRLKPSTGVDSQFAGAAASSSSPSVRLRRMLDMVRVDESAADIRDMNRRLQRMLEETLSKNLVLQKDIELLLAKDKK